MTKLIIAIGATALLGATALAVPALNKDTTIVPEITPTAIEVAVTPQATPVPTQASIQNPVQAPTQTQAPAQTPNPTVVPVLPPQASPKATPRPIDNGDGSVFIDDNQPAPPPIVTSPIFK